MFATKMSEYFVVVASRDSFLRLLSGVPGKPTDDDRLETILPASVLLTMLDALCFCAISIHSLFCRFIVFVGPHPGGMQGPSPFRLVLWFDERRVRRCVTEPNPPRMRYDTTRSKGESRLDTFVSLHPIFSLTR